MTLTARLVQRRLADPPYLAFPLVVDPVPGGAGPHLADRAAHVRAQIEQVLFTLARERAHRPEFGAGAKALLFEPNASPLWQVTQRRLSSALAEALKGEVDPKSLVVEVGLDEVDEGAAPPDASRLVIRVSYALAAVNQREEARFRL
jgi:uncharacterized protein